MRKAIIAGAVAIVVVTVSALALTGVASATTRPTNPNSHHFTVVERAITDTTADTGPAGDSLGDVLAFGNPIYNAGNTVKIGSDNGSCIRTAVGAAYECNWTTTLAGGSLVVEGPFYDTHDSQLAIIGGTGRYVGASGQMTLHARNAAGSAYDFTFDLLH
jgi:allene oxide cyclase